MHIAVRLRCQSSYPSDASKPPGVVQKKEHLRVLFFNYDYGYPDYHDLRFLRRPGALIRIQFWTRTRPL